MLTFVLICVGTPVIPMEFTPPLLMLEVHFSYQLLKIYVNIYANVVFTENILIYNPHSLLKISEHIPDYTNILYYIVYSTQYTKLF